MSARDPIARLGTHEVTNQPPPFEDYNLYDGDPALKSALAREGAGWAEDKVRAMGALAGDDRIIQLGRAANRHGPELRTFDAFGRRIDEVEFHPAYHDLMRLASAHEVHSIAWTAKRPGGHVAHTALEYLLTQAEAGVCCPITMTYASIPTLRSQPDIAAEWEPRILSGAYDPRSIPAAEKTGATIGMAMTEKQGGSDVRANTTRAEAVGAGGPGAEYRLRGHKWFCSAPMSDAFLTLAYADKGLSCFFVPRWRPDGTRNVFLIQRLKDKLGNRSNASAEIEYDGTYARLVGEEGRGVRTIIDMVHHTRLDATTAPAGMMRQAAVLAVHHARHRTAFQRQLAEQPLMKNVLADLVLESEAATVLVMRIARSYDEAATNEAARAFSRIAVAVGKYWINKRLPNHVYEAMECHGGGGYVEDSPMPRLYREAPVNSIWEGSGNVICLDVLRAMEREPDSIAAFVAEIEATRGADRRLDAAIDALKDDFARKSRDESQMRRITERMALTLQGALLMQFSPAAVADGFCASRLGDNWGRTYGTLPSGVAFDDIIARARFDRG
ncbi:MAG: acyl-CoA dehydrogenase family protein [Rhodospirillales bacterium]|nr:acyl-CoA dehydrogenase family protein [Rhodospirillales bacterium]